MKQINFWIGLFLIGGSLLLWQGCAGKPREVYTPPEKTGIMSDRYTPGTEAGENSGLYEQKRRRSTIEEYTRIKDTWYTDYGDTKTNLQAGLQYISVGLYDQAEKEFIKALDYNPYFAPAYRGLGVVYLAKDLFYMAEEALVKSIELKPDDPQSFYWLAVTYCELSEIENDPLQRKTYQKKAALNAGYALNLDSAMEDPADILDGDCIKNEDDRRPMIMIRTEPIADIYLGQDFIGNGSVTIKTDLDNIHDVTAEKEGYVMKSRRIYFEKEGYGVLTITLQRVENEAYPMSGEPIRTEIKLSDVVLFDLDKAVLKSSSQAILNDIGLSLEKQLNGRPVHIIGHTCDLGKTEYNQKLSERRAQAVATYLANNFNIPREKMVIIGKGESEPEVPNTSDENRQKNRRTVIEF